jgi:hypothetical protein
MMNGKMVSTVADYMNDETRVSPAERERIYLEAALIGEAVKAREEKGLSLSQ